MEFATQISKVENATRFASLFSEQKSISDSAFFFSPKINLP
jgi:hypothetical protein